MKITTRVFAAFLMILSFQLGSCKKEATIKPVSTTSVSLEKIDNDLRTINAKYAVKGSFNKTTRLSGNTAAIAGADLVAGIGMASNSWSWCVTPFGSFAAGFCTGLAAGVASYGMYKTCGGWLVVNGTTGSTQHQKDEIIAMVGTYQIPNPYNNPYDGNGVQHNNLVKALCSKPQDLPLTTSTLMFAATDFTQQQLDALQYDNTHVAYGLDAFITSQNVFDQSGNITYTPMIQTYFANDANLQNIVTVFMQGYTQITDKTSAMSFINDYENYFINTKTNLTQNELFALLNGFSIGKYSYAMWDDAFSVN